MSLRLKLFVLMAGITILPTTGVTAVALWRDLQRGQELLYREGATLAAQVAPAAVRVLGSEPPGSGDRAAVEDTLQRLLRSAPLVRAWVVDRQGHVVICADTPSHRGCPGGMPGSFVVVETPAQVLGRMLEPEGIVASAPVQRAGEVVGAVWVDFSHEEVVGTARRLAWGSAAVAIFWILLGQALAAVLFAGIVRSLRPVVKAAEELAEGERGLQLPPPGDKELADLVIAFNRMSARLKARRDENEALIAQLEARVQQKTREVLRADRLATLGGIAAGFAHELGNSLNVIRGYTGVMLRELPEDHPHRPDLEVVKRETRRAASLLERFLVFARSRSTKAMVQSLEPVLREAVEVVGPAAAQAGVETSVEVVPGAPPVNADAELLRQAFLNLCVNAIQAMQPGGGRLEVRLGPDGGNALLEFRDTGPGMAPEVTAHVFEPFYTTKASGTGLGLAIVRQAVETHGGTVEVESTPGQGALFRIRLPGAEGEKR